VADNQFGGEWTEKKLDKVRLYLPAYMNILKNKPWLHTQYIDAFAGTGYRSLRESCPEEANLFAEFEASDIESYRAGSSKIALETKPPFGEYIFIERDRKKCKELGKLRLDSPPDIAKRIIILNREANECLSEFCAQPRDWEKKRAVLFLDPFGMQVDWKTIEAIASTEAIDLWYLFPIGAVNRLLQRGGCSQPGFAERLDRVFGTHDWESRFYRKSGTPSLFDEERIIKDTDFDGIGDYILERLDSIFAGIATKRYILRNSKKSPLYMLCFAVSNKSAVHPAIRIAEHLLKD
jgi:three-Cys-motif partner protein